MSDLFAEMDRLFQHQDPPDNPPSFWVIHRFLASDPDYAQVAKQIAPITYDDRQLWAIWTALLPRADSAPRLRYPAPTKEKAAEGLEKALMQRHHYNRTEAEDTVEILTAAGRLQEACTQYGISDEK